ncbi:hypothetical protein GQX73_g1368 [Xylaria multiplex]|uniref:Rhodopsin domain-containing protein n=1 Tax=Xylaria multiplex TaxID=323545 RepID=A0A7C8IWH9_9PEZI|nr:hypothetical protein GQX73_g1368 [Xylaria multiplex]
MDADTNTNTTVGAIIAVLAIVSVAARFYVRCNRKAGLKWDDWLILVSLLITLGADILAIVGLSLILESPFSTLLMSPSRVNSFQAITSNPSGPNKATITVGTTEYTPADIFYTKLSWATTVLYFSITSTTKLSILFLYNRLFSVDQLCRRLIILLSVLVLIFWTGGTLADLLNCVPTKYVWINSQDDPRYCINFNIFWFSSAVVEALLDVMIILLPIKVVMGLQFTTKQKIAVTSVFLVGAFVIASGLLKAIFGYIPGSLCIAGLASFVLAFQFTGLYLLASGALRRAFGPAVFGHGNTGIV